MFRKIYLRNENKFPTYEEHSPQDDICSHVLVLSLRRIVEIHISQSDTGTDSNLMCVIFANQFEKRGWMTKSYGSNIRLTVNSGNT